VGAPSPLLRPKATTSPWCTVMVGFFVVEAFQPVMNPMRRIETFVACAFWTVGRRFRVNGCVPTTTSRAR